MQSHRLRLLLPRLTAIRQMSSSIVEHYSEGSLMSRIMEGLALSGIDEKTVTPEQLHPVDQFHLGGVKAVQSLLSSVEIKSGCRVLDLGCGIGGTSRLIAGLYPETTVVGVDVTPEFVDVSKELTAMVNMEGIDFIVGSGTEIPVDDSTFDLVIMVYVGMNIEDKQALFREVHRVLAPGGTFALKDAVLEDGKTNEDLLFPVPWATEVHHSFATQPETYINAASEVGLHLAAGPTSRREEGQAFLKNSPGPSGPPPLSLPRITFGLDGISKMKNVSKLIASETIYPCEMVFKKC